MLNSTGISLSICINLSRYLRAPQNQDGHAETHVKCAALFNCCLVQILRWLHRIMASAASCGRPQPGPVHSPHGSSRQGQETAAQAPSRAGGMGQVLTFRFPSKLYVTLFSVMQEDVKTNHQSRYSRTFFLLVVFLLVFVCVCVCLKYKIPDGGIW